MMFRYHVSAFSEGNLVICCYIRFISIPKDMGTFNCGAFVAGIVKVRQFVSCQYVIAFCYN